MSYTFWQFCFSLSASLHITEGHTWNVHWSLPSSIVTVFCALEYGCISQCPDGTPVTERHAEAAAERCWVFDCDRSFKCLQKAMEVLHRSFEPKLFVCRRLFLEGTKCPHSPLWWVDMSLGSVLDMMDYLRMSIADSYQDFRGCLNVALSDLRSPDPAKEGSLAHCQLLMQTIHGTQVPVAHTRGALRAYVNAVR